MGCKWFGVFLVALVMLIAAGCVKDKAINVSQGQTNFPLTVKVLDIGQGDAILIRAVGQTVLVDTGDTGTKDNLVAYIKKEGITTIDKVIITHPHADHLGGMSAVLENFKVNQIYDSGQTTTTVLYRKYLSLVQSKKIPFSVLTAGMEIVITNDIKLKILAPEQPFIRDSELNNNSIVAKLMYRDFSMLLTGDAEKESEERMLKKYKKELKSTILKSGHHGSNTSSSPSFLKAVSPEAAIISLGANNDYHHPHPSTLKKYNEAKMKIYRTDTDGTVTINSDGAAYTITKEK
ncbi:ComEC/Rec2 family competence protein [Pelosinus propionicus]|uniref:Competence protein ComEC n=1 Tax=Pelosinus propionicus DSM 13327 TaxID=1123291 RepID=A0A1I4M1C7_9FIRM|nr:ComEC/Rec2 family competence protein [Pelosinus propionicus]SFL97188.1 competence protein ComEC [Pelosinus propionicus DSM 13327]